MFTDHVTVNTVGSPDIQKFAMRVRKYLAPPDEMSIGLVRP